jgi:hypothetical protein
MTRHIAHAVIAAVVLAAPLGAQSPQPGQSSQPAQPGAAVATQSADGQNEQKTAIGCVAAGADGRTFTFTEAAGAAAASAAPASWTLMARSDVDLAKYVGKKVEVTGKPDAKGGASAYPDSGASRSPSATTGPRFHVKSVRVLAETCS